MSLLLHAQTRDYFNDAVVSHVQLKLFVTV